MSYLEFKVKLQNLSVQLVFIFVVVIFLQQINAQIIKDEPSKCLAALRGAGVNSLNDLSPLSRFLDSQVPARLEPFAAHQYEAIGNYCSDRVSSVFFGRLSSLSIERIKIDQMEKCQASMRSSEDAPKVSCLEKLNKQYRMLKNMNGGTAGADTADARLKRKDDGASAPAAEVKFMICCTDANHILGPIDSPGGLCEVGNQSLYPCDSSRNGFSKDDPRTIAFEIAYRPELARQREKRTSNPLNFEFFNRKAKKSGTSN